MLVLLTGARGQLGTDVVAAAAKISDLELVAIDRHELDITDQAATLALVRDVSPDVIILSLIHI